MSVSGRRVRQALRAHGVKIAILAARWHDELVSQMINSSIAEAKRCGIDDVTVVRVEGSGELPFAAQVLAESGEFDALVAIGLVMRGETVHFDTVLKRATEGLLQVSLKNSLPIADAVVAVENTSQAKDRVGGPGSREDKGGEAMYAALDLALLRRQYPPKKS